MSGRITRIRGLALSLTFFFLLGCVPHQSRVEESHYMTKILSTGKRYDNLLELLQKNLSSINKKRPVDLEGKLYVLDDLAFVYTFGLVDFHKAYETNQEAKRVLVEIEKKGIGNLPISPYFNANRSLYYYLYPGSLSTRNVNVVTKKYYGAVEGRKVPYVSLASLGLLDFIRERDIQLAKERIEARERFLSAKLALSESAGRSFEGATIESSNESHIIKNLLEPLNIYNDYYLNFHRAARLWHLAYTVNDPALYSHILLTGAEAISQKDSLKLPDDYRSIIYLNYWTGISALKLHQNSKGINYLEAFNNAIDIFEDQEAAEEAARARSRIGRSQS